MLDIIVNIIFVILLITFIFCCMMLVRNNIVHNARTRALYMSLDKYMANKTTYDQMMWDLRKWKFEQFYPEFNEERKE